MPILKPNKPAEDPDSYRAVAITPLLSRLAERIVADRLVMRLRDKLHVAQQGFRRGRCPIDATAVIVAAARAGFKTSGPNLARTDWTT